MTSSGCLQHGLGERAENDAGLGQLFLEGRGDRNAVEHGVDGDAGKPRAFVQRNAELVIGFQELRVDLIEAFRTVFVGLRCGVVGDRVVVDLRVVHVRPLRLLHVEPLPIGLQAPLEHELGFLLACRNRAHDILVQSRRQAVARNIGDKAVLVAAIDQVFNVFGICSHVVSSLFPR